MLLPAREPEKRRTFDKKDLVVRFDASNVVRSNTFNTLDTVDIRQRQGSVGE